MFTIDRKPVMIDLQQAFDRESPSFSPLLSPFPCAKFTELLKKVSERTHLVIGQRHPLFFFFFSSLPFFPLPPKVF